METPARKIVQLLIEHDPASAEFRAGVRETLHERSRSAESRGIELNLWKDVFVEQPLPWGTFAQSGILHLLAFSLIWALSLAWLRQTKILAPTPFDRSSVITYAPEEYLPPLDTGETEAPKQQTGDPAFAKQPILSVPREADSHSQTVVVPPTLKLDHDVPLPNIVAIGPVAPTVPLRATSSLSSRANSPDPQVVAPAPEVEVARNRYEQAVLRSDIVPPPPEVRRDRSRGMSGPDSAVVEPPPDLKMQANSLKSTLNIGPSAAVAPAPQLPMAEQHASTGRGHAGGRELGSAQVVAPPPSLAGASGGGAPGRMVVLGIHPVTPTGPVVVPEGNRRGAFEANPRGKPNGAGTPEVSGAAGKTGSGLKGRSNSLPAGLHVGAVPGAVGSIEQNGGSIGNGVGDGREVASLSNTDKVGGGASSGRRAASGVSDDKVSDLDRQVFGGRRLYGTTLNMPNLNSATGSWVMHFAELQPDQKGDLLQPLPTEKSDPGYPLELMRDNVHGTVTLYAVIHADGRVDGIRVLESPDDRLDSWAINALASWKFVPAERAGKPVAVEAVVKIPFRAKKAF